MSRNTPASQTGRNAAETDNIICSSCEEYFNSAEAFHCPRCRKGPLCKKHRLAGKKECLSCSIDIQMRNFGALKREEKSLRSFISFLQFVLILVLVFFTLSKVGIIDEIDFLKNNMVIKNILYIGIANALALAFFYFLMITQKQKIEKFETELNKMTQRR